MELSDAARLGPGFIRLLCGARISRNELSRSRLSDLRVPGNKGPLMTDDRQWPDDAEVQRIIIRKIAHDLSMFYAVETALPPRLQALVQRLDEQQELNR
jgi:hypothetical protein